ncbi:hypothetical protein [Sphingomonas sp.]|uniref:hypothetical protein n=1 Tax=Sphingomonas sp. TaxID=28214 RepID=UPI0035A824FC
MAAPVEAQRDRDGAIEEIAVMADDQHGPVIIANHFLQQIERFEIEIVGRLVEDQQVGGAGEFAREPLFVAHPGCGSDRWNFQRVCGHNTVDRRHHRERLVRQYQQLDLTIGVGSIAGTCEVGLFEVDFDKLHRLDRVGRLCNKESGNNINKELHSIKLLSAVLTLSAHIDI